MRCGNKAGRGGGGRLRACKVRARLPTAAIAFPGRSRARLLARREADDGDALVSLIWLHYRCSLAGSIKVKVMLRKDEARGRVPLSSISQAAAVGQETFASSITRSSQPLPPPPAAISVTRQTPEPHNKQ